MAHTRRKRWGIAQVLGGGGGFEMKKIALRSVCMAPNLTLRRILQVGVPRAHSAGCIARAACISRDLLAGAIYCVNTELFLAPLMLIYAVSAYLRWFVCHVLSLVLPLSHPLAHSLQTFVVPKDK